MHKNVFLSERSALGPKIFYYMSNHHIALQKVKVNKHLLLYNLCFWAVFHYLNYFSFTKGWRTVLEYFNSSGNLDSTSKASLYSELWVWRTLINCQWHPVITHPNVWNSEWMFYWLSMFNQPIKITDFVKCFELKLKVIQIENREKLQDQYITV